MKKFFFTLALLGSIFYSNYLLCQSSNTRVIHVIDTSYHNSEEDDICLHKILLMNKEEIYELIELKNYLEDFTFYGITQSQDSSIYIVFENYGSAAGISELFYINESIEKIYISDPIFEYEIPIIKSFDEYDTLFKIVTFKEGECGKIENKNVRHIEQNEIIYINKELPRNYKIIAEYTISISN